MHPTLALQDNTEHLTAKDVFLWNALEHLYRTMTAESLSRSLRRCQLGPTRTAFHLWRWCPPSLFKVGGSPFDILPGGTSPERVRPDIVHTFHLGFGVDMAASIIVWLCHLGCFGDGRPPQSFEEKLTYAHSSFRECCHQTKWFTACDHWTTKKFSMASALGFYKSIFEFQTWKVLQNQTCTTPAERGM